VQKLELVRCLELASTVFPAFEITQTIFFLRKMEKNNKGSTMEYALHGPTLLPFRRHLQQPL
jgi:hypothetical protein